MNFKPKGDRILIRPDEKLNSIAGITLMESDIQEPFRGTVMAVGTGVQLTNVNVNLSGELSEAALNQLEVCLRLIKEGREIKYNVGETVIYGRYAGTKVKIDGEEYLMIREADCFGVIEENSGEHDY